MHDSETPPKDSMIEKVFRRFVEKTNVSHSQEEAQALSKRLAAGYAEYLGAGPLFPEQDHALMPTSPRPDAAGQPEEEILRQGVPLSIMAATVFFNKKRRHQ